MTIFWIFSNSLLIKLKSRCASVGGSSSTSSLAGEEDEELDNVEVNVFASFDNNGEVCMSKIRGLERLLLDRDRIGGGVVTVDDVVVALLLFVCLLLLLLLLHWLVDGCGWADDKRAISSLVKILVRLGKIR